MICQKFKVLGGGGSRGRSLKRWPCLMACLAVTICLIQPAQGQPTPKPGQPPILGPDGQPLPGAGPNPPLGPDGLPLPGSGGPQPPGSGGLRPPGTGGPPPPPPPGAGTRPPDGKRAGFLLKLNPLEMKAGTVLKVFLKGESGKTRTMMVEDNGKVPDMMKGDGMYAASVPSFPDDKVSYVIEGGGSKWTGEFAHDPKDLKPMIFLTLQPDGTAKVMNKESTQQIKPMSSAWPTGAPMAAKPPEGGGKPGPPNKPAVVMATWDIGPGYLLWSIFFFTFGLGLALIVAYRGRLGRGKARLSRLPAAGDIDTVRIPEAQVLATLETGLEQHRVVVFGRLPRTSLDVITCEEEAPLPEELTQAVEHLAVSPGQPVALLVTQPDLLDRQGREDPVTTLERLVDRRFPLWIVEG